MRRNRFGIAGGVLVLTVLRALGQEVLPPPELIAYAGDRSVVLHWPPSPSPSVIGYRLEMAVSAEGPFVSLTNGLVRSPSFVHFVETNGTRYFYRVRAVNSSWEESAGSPVASATPHPFADDTEFLRFVQRAHFDYFWYEANATNGLVRDRSTSSSPCSIAAVGFGLTAIGIGIDQGWISREQGRERTLLTLRTFLNTPQGDRSGGFIGYRGWFYHFLDMRSARRTWSSELSSIDTALFLAGALYARSYFDGSHSDEVAIRETATELFNRVDWNWMRAGGDTLRMGWKPEGGFLSARWVGYNEAMILYLLGLGAENDPLPAGSWPAWTAGYSWRTNHGLAFVPFPPLFGHQYSHAWVDFRHVADAYMRAKGLTYFENSRRATLANRAYCIENPAGFRGYGTNVWGLTACDGPGYGRFLGYSARGAPPAFNDDGTIAPTAAGGSLPFAPEVCLPALRHFYDAYRTNLWTGYGFRDAFNLTANWWDPDVLGIDQGPIVIMIENYLTQGVWKRMATVPDIRRGLERAGFTPVDWAQVRARRLPADGSLALEWEVEPRRTYQVEYSPDLARWYASPSGWFVAGQEPLLWVDAGPPATPAPPRTVAQRFYRVFALPAP